MNTLSSDNVISYFYQLNSHLDFPAETLSVQSGKEGTKNTLFLLQDLNGKSFLVKQERPTFMGVFGDDLLNEWYLHQFLKASSVGLDLTPYIRSMTGYLPESLVGIYEYLSNYEEFHTHVLQKESIFPTKIDGLIGHVLARIHRTTLNHAEAKAALTQNNSFWQTRGSMFSLFNHRITPEMMGSVPPEYIRFIRLYQRFASLDAAVQEAFSQWQPCCLVHNDLNVANILIHKDWRMLVESHDFNNSIIVKIIDWERSSWGDPVMDLGYLVSNYLMLWITSMVIDPQMDLTEALETATTNLEDVSPSIKSLVKFYLQAFPESLSLWPNWTRKLMQSVGIGLIIQTQARIEYSATLGNCDIYALQIAKSFLCKPEASFPSIFGFLAEDLVRFIEQ